MASSPNKSRKSERYAADASDVAEAEREVQAEIDARDTMPKKSDASAPQRRLTH